MSLWSEFPFRWPLTSEAQNSLASHRGERVCHFGPIIWALLDVLFPFIQLGNVPWSSGQSFPQPPWDFMKKKKVEQVTVLLSGNEWDCKAEPCLSVCASLTPGSRTRSWPSAMLTLLLLAVLLWLPQWAGSILLKCLIEGRGDSEVVFLSPLVMSAWLTDSCGVHCVPH